MKWNLFFSSLNIFAGVKSLNDFAYMILPETKAITVFQLLIYSFHGPQQNHRYQQKEMASEDLWLGLNWLNLQK